MKKKKAIFEFFGINKPLFLMGGLEGDEIRRFIDREEELQYFIASIDMGQTCAVIGEQGVGKSSFLLKLDHMISDSNYSKYLQFSFPGKESEKSRHHFLRMVLRSILYLIAENDELLELYDTDDIAYETGRLEYSIIVENQATTTSSVHGEIGGGIGGKLTQLLLPAELKAKVDAKREKVKGKTEKKEYYVHNEHSLYSTIHNLLEKMNTPIVLLIDELDKVGREPLESPEWDDEVMKILELSRDIVFNRKLILVFSLQEELYEKLRKALRNEGDVSILGLINRFKKLECFDSDLAKEAVRVSIEHAGYKGGLGDLFEDGVIEIALAAGGGNPRLLMSHLMELAIRAFMKKQEKITLDLLKEHLYEMDGEKKEKWDELINEAVRENAKADVNQKEKKKGKNI